MSAKKKPAAKKAAKRGRPSKFTSATAAQICERLSKGEPMAAICRHARMPAVSTVHEWMDRDAGFSGSIARARERGFDALAAECLAIADTPKVGNTRKVSPDGTTITTEDMLGHRKLQIETRLKLLAKWDPKRYGERLDVNAKHSGSISLGAVLAEIDSAGLPEAP